jgi:acetylornithine deacetylase/succinyl-diaminopimelate desuccinylase-like protein
MTSPTLYSRIDRYIEDNLGLYVAWLGRLCAVPGVSAQGQEMESTATLVAGMLRERGYRAEILPTAGYPVVYGERPGRSERTMLFYLHYDVQPADPLELWHSSPWALTLRDEALYARGALDDKGHIVTRMAALDAWLAVTGELPCRVKFLIEGEEEIGSPSLEPFVRRERERLSADACIWEFGGVDASGNPVLALGLRGILFAELSVRTANRDIHSGQGGSIFPSAAWRLLWAVNSLKSADERILIPGFYDDVRLPSARDMALLARLPDNATAWRDLYGMERFLLDRQGGTELRRAAVFDPTCNICGFHTGYDGPGGKTIIPAEARAKLDFRLVPDQRPDDIAAKLRAHLDAQQFGDVQLTVTGGYAPARVDPDDPFVQTTVQAAQAVWGREPVIEPMTGVSGPMAWFVDNLGVPVVTTGIGAPGGQVHAPNEHVRLENLVRGIRHTAHIIGRFAETPPHG